VPSLVRRSDSHPIIWRSDAPLGAESTAGLWCALALRTRTGCAILISDHTAFLETLREAGPLLQKSKYLVGFELPWRQQAILNSRCSVSVKKWLAGWGWTLASRDFTQGHNPLAIRIGEALKMPAFGVSTGYLHARTRAETLNLDDLQWTYKTFLLMMEFEKKQRGKT
jgi:hypothetical protein